jgi:hypothetical protein
MPVGKIMVPEIESLSRTTNPKIIFKKLQITFNNGEETLLKGVMCVSPVMPLTKCGIALNKKNPEKNAFIIKFTSSPNVFITYYGIIISLYTVYPPKIYLQVEDIADPVQTDMTAEVIDRQDHGGRVATEYREGVPFRVGSLADKEDVRDAITLIKSGEVVAAQMWGVFGLWVRGDSPEAIKKALTVKKDPHSTKAISSMMLSEDFLRFIDVNSVHASLRDLLNDVERFQNKLGALCHIRAPIKSELVNSIPASMVSQENGKFYMHNLDPTGHILMEPFIRNLRDEGVMFNAVMSLNDHSIGEAEIHQRTRAIQYCAESGQVGLMLEDITYGNSGATGSFGIMDTEHAKAVRDGIVPIEIIEKILGHQLSKDGMKESKYKQTYHAPIVELDITAEDIRGAIIGRITSIKLQN